MNTSMTKKMIAAAASDLFNADLDIKMSKAKMEEAFYAEGVVLAETLRDEALEAGCNKEAVSMLAAQMISDPLSEQGLAAQERLEELIEARTAPPAEETKQEVEVVEKESNVVALPAVVNADYDTADLHEALAAGLAAGLKKAQLDRMVNDWIESHDLPDPPLSAQEVNDKQFALWQEGKQDEAVQLLISNNERGQKRAEMIKELQTKADHVWAIVSEPYKEELSELQAETQHLEEQISNLEKLLNVKPTVKKATTSWSATSNGLRSAIIVDGMSNRQFNLHCLKEGLYTRDEIVAMAHDKGYGSESECRKRLTGLLGQLRAKGQLIEGEDRLALTE